jgi:hypothetical protein
VGAVNAKELIERMSRVADGEDRRHEVILPLKPIQTSPP